MAFAGERADVALITPGVGLGIPAYIFKGTGESVSSATTGSTLQDDDALQFELAPGVRYVFDFNINASGPTAADFKTAFAGPADMQGIKFAVGPAIATTTGWVDRDDTNGRFSVHGLTTVTSYALGTAGSAIREYGWVSSVTGGTFKLQWAQNSPNASATSVGLSSFAWYMRAE